MTMSKTLARASAAAVATMTVFAFAIAPATSASAEHHDNKAQPDIVDTAIAAGTFQTLTAAVQAAGLEDTLRSDGPFTVFAPTDEAFDKLAPGTVDALLKPENKDQLTSILTYHVLPGKVYSKSIAGKTTAVETVQGSELAVDGTQGVTVDKAKVVAADIETANGVIHVIDTVLIP